MDIGEAELAKEKGIEVLMDKIKDMVSPTKRVLCSSTSGWWDLVASDPPGREYDVVHLQTSPMVPNDA